MAGKQNMGTPRWLVSLLSDKFIDGRSFALDAAASWSNAVCWRYYGERLNGLRRPWRDRTFCNPPFLNFGMWVSKAIIEASFGHRVVLVGPTGCSQSWFHRIMDSGLFTCYAPDRRINFLLPNGIPTKSADRDTMIFVSAGHDVMRWTIRPLQIPR